MLNRENLYHYQRNAVEWIKSHTHCALFLEMGLGKTISTLTAFCELKQEGAVHKALIIAPKRVAERTWTDEVQRWSHLSHLSTSKVLGTPTQRIKALKADADLYITNRENVAWLYSTIKNRNPWEPFPFDTLIIDELSSFKAYNTQRFKSLKKIRHEFKRIIGLTGTPSPNSLLDLWSQLYLLDGGDRLGKFITNYRQLYFLPLKGRGNVVYEWKLKPHADALIYSKVNDICMSMKACDYIDLPPVRYIDTKVGLTPAELKQYNTFKIEQVLSLGGETITAGNAAILGGKLQQWTSGALYTDDGGTASTTPAKMERLKEMLEELTTPVLIAYNYKHELSRLKAEFPQAKTLDEDGAFDAWNRGEVPILLGHPQSMGHGLNLQRGGHTIIWFTLTWSLELYEQMNARLARQGQTKSVSIYHLIAQGTIDERVLMVLQRKATAQDALMAELKADQ